MGFNSQVKGGGSTTHPCSTDIAAFPDDRSGTMAQLRTLPMPREDPGSKAVATADDEFHSSAIGMRPSATLSSKGRQGHATLSMALDDEITHRRTSLSTPEGFITKWGWIPYRDPPSPPPSGERTGALPAGEVGAWKLIN